MWVAMNQIPMMQGDQNDGAADHRVGRMHLLIEQCSSGGTGCDGGGAESAMDGLRICEVEFSLGAGGTENARSQQEISEKCEREMNRR